ncbi:hypothetical protein B4U80_11922, partial [Leptotrombidium deliense]
ELIKEAETEYLVTVPRDDVFDVVSSQLKTALKDVVFCRYAEAFNTSLPIYKLTEDTFHTICKFLTVQDVCKLREVSKWLKFMVEANYRRRGDLTITRYATEDQLKWLTTSFLNIVKLHLKDVSVENKSFVRIFKGKFSELKILRLSSACLIDVPTIGSCFPNLTELTLEGYHGNERYKHPISTLLSTLKHLKHLNLEFMCITPADLEEVLPRLESLSWFAKNSNQFCRLSNLSRAEKLKCLKLNFFDGELSLSNLNNCRVNEVHISGPKIREEQSNEFAFVSKLCLNVSVISSADLTNLITHFPYLTSLNIELTDNFKFRFTSRFVAQLSHSKILQSFCLIDNGCKQKKYCSQNFDGWNNGLSYLVYRLSCVANISIRLRDYYFLRESEDWNIDTFGDEDDNHFNYLWWPLNPSDTDSSDESESTSSFHFGSSPFKELTSRSFPEWRNPHFLAYEEFCCLPYRLTNVQCD